MITFQINNLKNDEVAPLYKKYPREHNIQGAFVEIDEDGVVTASANPEIGNGIPMAVFHGLTRRIRCLGTVSGAALYDFLQGEEGFDLLTRIHDGFSQYWDGNNWVGKQSEDAAEAEKELESALAELPQIEVFSASEWIEHDSLETIWPKGKTFEEAIENASIANEPNQVSHPTDKSGGFS